ncbi:hypothetical protein KC318_g1701 [Hortaea werneckii]|uniref:Uncharacterized protein n=1 Tax=Hortaea werneckii TaxID=91943 RepID=A0A3M6Z2G0_HORWE|nr:hypothetical protein KC334_g1758 [Hortaea werneckii]KAI7012401.1 hypothetical protein KC355_g5421 [Hortaea werneckii]KAI7674267.1 hypothetical protein KC318_g1701 [Hortaea werneckii]RMY09490.1 hypothetical protein D0866_14610 [Hortaea werneckii]
MADDITPTSSQGTTSSERSSLKPRPLNFSRPRPTRVDSKQKIYHDHSGGGGGGSGSGGGGGGGGRVRGISAFHEPSGASASNGRDHLPREPRFSIDSDLTTSTSSNSAASEFAWDDTSGELRSRRPDEVQIAPRRYERSQRYSKDSTTSSNPARSATSSSTAGGGSGGSGGSSSSNTAVAAPGSSISGTSSSSTSRPFIAELPGSEPQQQPSLSSHRPSPLQKQQQHLQPRHFPPPSSPQIIKRTSVDQQSERMSTSTTRDWEDTASHHTVSIYDGETGHHNPYHHPPSSSSFDAGGGGNSSRKDSTTTANSNGSNNTSSQWTSSEFSTTGLSEAEIRKLKKKGINPSLYAEMKAARKGKGKWVGPLVGNTFIG